MHDIALLHLESEENEIENNVNNDNTDVRVNGMS